MTISQPCLSLKPCSSREIPPITATVRIPSGRPNLRVSSSICWANSRVGANMTAYGPWSASSSLRKGRNGEMSKILTLIKIARQPNHIQKY